MPLDLEKLDLVDALPTQCQGDPLSYQSGWYNVGQSKHFFEGTLYKVVNVT